MLSECKNCKNYFDDSQAVCPFCKAPAFGERAETAALESVSYIKDPLPLNFNRMMLECPSCGQSFLEGVIRCPYCGADAPEIKRKPDDKKKETPYVPHVRILVECVNCAKPFNKDELRCPFCGAPAPLIDFYKPPEYEGSFAYADFFERRRAMSLDIAIGILFGLIAVVSVYLINRDNITLTAGVFFIANAFYYIGFEASHLMATPGKLIFGLEVTDKKGKRLSIPRAAFRLFAKFISAAILGIGFFLPLILSKEQTLHDIISGSMVIKL